MFESDKIYKIDLSNEFFPLVPSVIMISGGVSSYGDKSRATEDFHLPETYKSLKNVKYLHILEVE